MKSKEVKVLERAGTELIWSLEDLEGVDLEKAGKGKENMIDALKSLVDTIDNKLGELDDSIQKDKVHKAKRAHKAGYKPK